MKIFNTAGPVNPEKHYLLDPLSRWDLDEIMGLIAQEKYFILHAPRQSGKTSALLALQRKLNAEGFYHCLYLNVEAGQSARENVPQAIGAVLAELRQRAKMIVGNDNVSKLVRDIDLAKEAHMGLNLVLTEWCATLDKPLVLLIDEIDALVGDSLISILRQLRSGYDKRPGHFPQTVVLCGLRDVRDYRIYSSTEKDIITGGSAFNIKSESLTLGSFSLGQIQMLYQQHTSATGQIFHDEIWQELWHYTNGQPWLVNALAYELCFKMVETKLRATAIRLEHLKLAKERLIQRRDTHLDQLVDKLKEPRIKRIIEPMLQGTGEESNSQDDDSQYAIDLGLIRKEKGSLVISNRIYQEIIPRVLVYEEQVKMLQDQSWYVDEKTHKLKTDKLLKAFIAFYQQNIEHWQNSYRYAEAAPQLLLQAFLQRIINGGGRISREYGLGRGRLDLFIEWPLVKEAFIQQGKIQRIIIEFKVLPKRGGVRSTEKKALQQISEYADRLRCKAEMHVLIVDQHSQKNWKEKLFERVIVTKNQKIKVWGL